jgi:hypothetical protein
VAQDRERDERTHSENLTNPTEKKISGKMKIADIIIATTGAAIILAGSGQLTHKETTVQNIHSPRRSL